jgi:hypothetical protein
MKKTVLSFALILTVLFPADAVTPMTEKPPADQVTRIECEYKKSANCPKWAFDAFKDEHPKFAKETVFHYRVYLPEGYYDNPDKRYPCMFITSPGGNASLGNLGARIKQDKWIAIMLEESKNNSPEWLSNFIAAHDDGVQRFRIQEGMKYATGFSGGARCAGTQVGVRPGFAGVILQGAGFNYNNSNLYIYDAVKNNRGIAICVIMGIDDSNKSELTRLRSELPRQNAVKYISSKGGHAWASAESMDEAMDWLAEQLIFTTEDKDVARLIFTSRLDDMNKLENGFPQYQALSMLSDIVNKHKLQKYPEISKSLKDIQTRLAALKKDPNIAKELKAKKAYDVVLDKEEKEMEKISTGKIKKDKAPREIERLISAYRAVIKANEGTFYAKKAEEKISQLEEGMKE